MVPKVASQGKNANLVQGHECIELHNGEVVTKQNECRHVNDILWSLPQVREQFGGTCSRKPDNITREDVPAEHRQYRGKLINFRGRVPPRQMVTALVYRFHTLRHEDGNKTWTNKEREWIEQFVNLNQGAEEPEKTTS